MAAETGTTKVALNVLVEPVVKLTLSKYFWNTLSPDGLYTSMSTSAPAVTGLVTLPESLIREPRRTIDGRTTTDVPQVAEMAVGVGVRGAEVATAVAVDVAVAVAVVVAVRVAVVVGELVAVDVGVNAPLDAFQIPKSLAMNGPAYHESWLNRNVALRVFAGTDIQYELMCSGCWPFADAHCFEARL